MPPTHTPAQNHPAQPRAAQQRAGRTCRNTNATQPALSAACWRTRNRKARMATRLATTSPLYSRVLYSLLNRPCSRRHARASRSAPGRDGGSGVGLRLWEG